jgi:hypothetical protein
MSQARLADADDEMRPEYDFSDAVRGRYHQRYRNSSNIVVLDPDVSQVFPNSTAVNQSLRLLVTAARKRIGATARSKTATKRPKRMQWTSGAAHSRSAARR